MPKQPTSPNAQPSGFLDRLTILAIVAIIALVALAAIASNSKLLAALVSEKQELRLELEGEEK